MKDIKDTDKDTEQIFVFLGAALYLFHEVVPSQAHYITYLKMNYFSKTSHLEIRT